MNEELLKYIDQQIKHSETKVKESEGTLFSYYRGKNEAYKEIKMYLESLK